MINLLPLKDRKNAQKEFLYRFIVLLSLGGLVLTLMAITILSSLFVLTKSFHKELNEQKIFTEELMKLKNVGDLEYEVVKINSLLNIYNTNEQRIQVISDDIFEILNVLPNLVKIESMSFDKTRCEKCAGEISLSGNAVTRDSLVSFVSKLKESGYFKEITSPISNLLAEEDIDFLLTVEIKDK